MYMLMLLTFDQFVSRPPIFKLQLSSLQALSNEHLHVTISRVNKINACAYNSRWKENMHY